MGERHLMNKLLGFFVVFSLVAVGVSVAHADGIKEFVVPVPFDYQNSGCTLVINGTDYKKYDCTATWKSEDFKYDDEERTPSEDGCISGMDIDIRTGECRPYDVIQEEAKQLCFDDPECPLGIYNPTIADPKIPSEDSDRPSDKELLKRINKELDSDPRCYQGQGTTLGVQNIRNFSISINEYILDGVKHIELDTSTPFTAMEYRGLLKEILTRNHECKAQMTLQNDQGGVLSSQDFLVGFCDNVPQGSKEFYPICGKTFSHSENAKSVPIMTQEMANQRANFGVDMSNNRYDIVEDVCEGFYTNTYKMTFKECRDIRDAKIELSGVAKTNLQDYHDNVPGQRYEQFLEDGGVKEGERLAKETLQDKISNLIKQINKMRASQK